ncbi:MAG: hypothetical protein Kow0069_38350 [Promethearchaeota archaeon]
MSSKPVVALCKRKPRESVQDATVRALDLAGVSDALASSETFLLKPNYIAVEPPEFGNVTCPETVEGVFRFLVERCSKSAAGVVIGEGSYPNSTERAFEVAGARRLADKLGVRLVNLNEDEFVEVDVPDPLALERVRVARTALDVDCVVSIPSLKTHSMAVTTLALKNLMGALTQKGKHSMHSRLHEKIADLASVIRPGLAVVDGIVGSDGFEEGGSPVRMDLVVAGTDPVAVDSVASAVMGYGPKQCRYLLHAEKKGLGVASLDGIDVVGESVDAVKRRFRR